MSANFYSIESPFQYEIEIKKSRFLTYLFPIETPEDAQEKLAQIKKEHYKASHHCSAYILKPDASIKRMSDDGEPSGTAGVPMLEVLSKQNLTNIMAVVVRYFGGTKLGAGGLVRAYSSAVSEALQHAVIVQNISQQMVSLALSYSQIDAFQYFLTTTELPITVLDTEYTDRVMYNLAINVEATEEVYQSLLALFNGQLEWQLDQIRTIDIKV